MIYIFTNCIYTCEPHVIKCHFLFKTKDSTVHLLRSFHIFYQLLGARLSPIRCALEKRTFKVTFDAFAVNFSYETQTHTVSLKKVNSDFEALSVS